MAKRKKRKKKLTKKKQRQLLGAAATIVCLLLGIPLVNDHLEPDSLPAFLQDPHGFFFASIETETPAKDESYNNNIQYNDSLSQNNDSGADSGANAGVSTDTEISYHESQFTIGLPALEGATLHENCRVIRVVDGDTVIVDLDGTSERVRLIGVDTPESVHPDKEKNVPYGEIASAFAKEMLEGKSVTLEMDVQERDRYNRILAYVYLDGIMFNGLLLEEGHAKIATYPPNVKYVDTFKAIQEYARSENRGLWEYEESTDTET